MLPSSNQNSSCFSKFPNEAIFIKLRVHSSTAEDEKDHGRKSGGEGTSATAKSVFRQISHRVVRASHSVPASPPWALSPFNFNKS